MQETGTNGARCKRETWNLRRETPPFPPRCRMAPGATMSLITIDWHPDLRKLRQFGLLMLAACAAFGLALAWKNGLPLLAPTWNRLYAIWSIGLACGLLALVRPIWLRPLYLSWMGLAFPIGWVLSHVLLGVVFYGVFTLVGALFRILRRDPLRLKRREGATSYWVERTTSRRAADYFRQF